MAHACPCCDLLRTGRVSWLVDNPGRQQIGSFHPITEGDWSEGAFISEATVAFVAHWASEASQITI